jgi:FlaA1/EpsC-like NDP-sugar epimerase
VTAPECSYDVLGPVLVVIHWLLFLLKLDQHCTPASLDMRAWDLELAAATAVLIACLAVAVPMNAEQLSETSVRSADVLILGAGVAGIVAASALQQKGASVIVIEARNRPYGRVDTVTPASWPIPIEVSCCTTQRCCAPCIWTVLGA